MVIVPLDNAIIETYMDGEDKEGGASHNEKDDHTATDMYTCILTYMFTNTHTRTYLHTYILTHIHTFTHTQIHTYTYKHT